MPIICLSIYLFTNTHTHTHNICTSGTTYIFTKPFESKLHTSCSFIPKYYSVFPQNKNILLYKQNNYWNQEIKIDRPSTYSNFSNFSENSFIAIFPPYVQDLVQNHTLHLIVISLLSYLVWNCSLNFVFLSWHFLQTTGNHIVEWNTMWV